MRTTDEFIFFWGGYFSQWYYSPIMVNYILFNRNEQFMMACKAKLFQDEEIYEKIMVSRNAAKQKQLGREVRNFELRIWNQHAKDIVTVANYAKFTQNHEIKKLLLDTGDRTIVEASPTDQVWGIGLHETHPDAEDPSKWNGANWLGECIMNARRLIREDREPDTTIVDKLFPRN